MDKTNVIVTYENMKKVALNYIPKAIIDSIHVDRLPQNEHPLPGDVEGLLIGNLFDPNISDRRLRQYGTTEELTQNLRIYRMFLGCEKAFGLTRGDTSRLYPLFYRTLDNQEVVSKADLFTYILQWLICKYRFWEIPHASFIFYRYISMRAEEFGAFAEFVSTDNTELQQLEQDFENIAINQKAKDLPSLANVLSNFSLPSMLSHWKRLVPSGWMAEELITLENLLDKVFEERNSEKCLKLYLESYAFTANMLESIERIIESRLSLFLPGKASRFIRLFDDNGLQFVMMEDLERFKTSDKRSEDKGQYLGALEVSEPYDRLPKGLSLVITPILRAKHAAVPIVTHLGNHCTLSSDALFLSLHDIIFGLKVFQKVKPAEWRVVEDMFRKLEEYFNASVNSIYFLTLDNAKSARQFAFDYFGPYHNVPAKDVRNAKSTGFTVQNLKNELSHLGLLDNFPDIADYVELAYRKVMKSKKEEHLRTCDLFDAVEHCQLICFFQRFPRYTQFLHIQRACKRVEGLVCYLCRPTNVKLFSNTMWNNVPISEVNVDFIHEDYKRITEITDTYLPKQKIVCADGREFVYNFEMYTKSMTIYSGDLSNYDTEVMNDLENKCYEKGILLSLVDKKTADEITDSFARYVSVPANRAKLSGFDSVIEYINDLEKQNRLLCSSFVLRTVSTELTESVVHKAVFADEVLAVLPLLLQNQRMDSDANREKLKNYWQMRKTNYGCHMIGMEELKKVLEDFDIDKTRITLIPDIRFTVSVQIPMPLLPGALYLRGFSAKKEPVMSASMATKWERREQLEALKRAEEEQRQKIQAMKMSEEAPKAEPKTVLDKSNPSTSSSSERETPPPPQKVVLKSCDKCIKASDKCNGARAKLKQSEKRNEELKSSVRKTERELKRIEENELKRRKNREEIERKIRELEEKIDSQSENDKDVDELKRRVVQMEAERAERLEKRQKLQEKLATVTDPKYVEKECEMLRKSLNKASKRNANLKQEHGQLSVLCAERQRTVDLLLSTMSKTERTPEMKEILLELHGKLNDMLMNDPNDEVKEKSEKVLSLVEEQGIKEFINLEVDTFRAKSEKYFKALEANISMIEKSFDIKKEELLELPEYPTLTEEFNAKYARAQYLESLEECPICLYKMDASTMSIMKCSTCQQMICEPCIELWSQTGNQLCPCCRRSLFDYVRVGRGPN
ncbi:unnamed protein product [Caenorhabditis sp. 36 PRJEB53466]|nr:unnamed protein product [Caenorhabditis sp. 36 PRJEB53466]